MNSRRLARALAAGGIASLAMGLLLMPAAASTAAVSAPSAAPVSQCAAPARSGSVTCTGPRLFNGSATKPGLLAAASKVTVTPATNLVNQAVTVSWQNFTPSGELATPPVYAENLTEYPVLVAECQGTDPAQDQCYTETAPGTGGSGPDGPYFQAFGITAANGTGQVNITIETSIQNQFLGCDQGHACSLVIVPAQGGTTASCSDHSEDAANATGDADFNTGTGAPACSWSNRIVVPLGFSAAARLCKAANGYAFTAAGGPLATRAVDQWVAALCAGRSPLSVDYVYLVQEPQAVSDVAGGAADVAFTTRPAGPDGVSVSPDKHVVYAPVAISAVSVAFWADKNDGSTYTHINLDPRLVAKMLTLSYNYEGTECQTGSNCDKGLKGNLAGSTFSDPEFLAENGGYDSKSPFSSPFLAATSNTLGFYPNNFNYIPVVASGNSDMTWTVTRWLAANSDASSFLAGQPDPWGAYLNQAFKGQKWPTDTFANSDGSTEYQGQYQPLFPTPLVSLHQSLAEAAGHAPCQQSPQGPVCTQDAPMSVGQRGMFSVVDQSTADADLFNVASLQNAAGQFVSPTNAAMAAAVSHMVSDGHGTLQMNLASKDPAAYPLTMVVYAMVPTAGLSHATAAAIARFLDYAAGPGQHTGLLAGQLPPGYLPLTASMRAQTLRDATAVADQSGDSPHHQGTGPGSGSGPGSGTGTGPGSSPANPGSGSSPSPGASPSVTLPSPTPSQRITTSALGNPAQSALTRYVLPAVLALGGVAALAGSSVLAGSSDGTVATLLARVRRLFRGG